jgi:hypothetical protein
MRGPAAIGLQQPQDCATGRGCCILQQGLESFFLQNEDAAPFAWAAGDDPNHRHVSPIPQRLNCSLQVKRIHLHTQCACIYHKLINLEIICNVSNRGHILLFF